MRRAIRAAVSDALPPLLFDRALVAARLDRAWRQAADRPGADFLLRRAAGELGERLALVKRAFAVAVDAGAPGPHAAAALAERPGGGATLRLAPTAASAGSGDFAVVVADAERLPLRSGAVSVAWTFLLLHHFPKLDKLPRELARVARDKVVAYEPNAQNMLTWLANNVVNRFIGISAMTPNQRALRPRPVEAAFAPLGFRASGVHYVDRKWSDSLGWVRRGYETLTAWLPNRFRANKFLIILEKRAA